MRTHKGVLTFALILIVCLICVLMSKWATEEPDGTGPHVAGTLLAEYLEGESPSAPGYYVNGTYDAANAQLTVEIGLKDISRVSIGRFMLGFDPEKLTVLRSDGNPLGDSFELTDVVLKDKSVQLSEESCSSSALISQTEGYVAFGWYANSRIDASKARKPVATIRFSVDGDLTASDLAGAYFLKDYNEVEDPDVKERFFIAAMFQCDDINRTKYGYHASIYSDEWTIYRDLDLEIMNPDGTIGGEDPPVVPEGHATYHLVSEPSADGSTYAVNVYLQDIAATKAAFGLWYDPQLLSLPDDGFELLVGPKDADNSSLWQSDVTSAYHTFAWGPPDGSDVINAYDAEVQIARYTFRVLDNAADLSNAVTLMDFSETGGGNALTDVDKYWKSVTGEDAPGYYQGHGWVLDADGNLDMTAAESQYDIHVTYETKEPTPPEQIMLVEVTDIDAPVALETPDTTGACESKGVAGIRSVTWSPEPVDGKFTEGEVYTVSVTVTAADGYVFSKDTKAKINGKPATVTFPEDKEYSDTLILSYPFPATAAPVKLTYIYNNGTGDREVVAAVKDVPTVTIAASTWEGSDFQYWYHADNGAFYNAGAAFTPTADAELKAIWQINLSSVALEVTEPVKDAAPQKEIPDTDQYTVESVLWADASGNVLAGNFAPSTVYTVTITLKAAALGNLVDGKYDDNGYAFIDPCSATLNGGNAVAAVTGSGIGNTLTLTYEFPATAGIDQYTVTYDGNCGDPVEGMPLNAAVNDGASYTLVTEPAPIRTGYTFAGWSRTADSTEAVTVLETVTQNITVYAIWTPTQVEWLAPPVGTYTYGTPIDPVIPAPTVVDPTSDIVNGRVYYQEKSNVLSEYGLTLNADGTISGTPTKAGTVLGLVITVTAKNGSTFDVDYDEIIVNKAPLTIEAKGKLEKDVSQMSSLKVSDFIAAATGLKLNDTVASLFTAPVDKLDEDGLFMGNGVTIQFYEKTDETRSVKMPRAASGDTSAPGTLLTALPDKEGTYWFRIRVPADDDTALANYILETMSEDGVLVVKEQSKPIIPPNGGSSSGVPYNTPRGSDSDHLAYMVGRANGLFDPDSDMTRAEAAAMMDRLSKGFTEKYPYPRALFGDLNTNAWYIQYVNFASNKGIINGYPDGSFRPDISITRGEFATMLANFLGIVKTQASSPYTDVYGHWAAGYITALSQRGIISGYSDGTFRPDRMITRAEAVTMMNGAIGRTPDGGLNLQTHGYVNPYPDIDKNAWFYEQVVEATIDHASQDFHRKKGLI